MWPFFGLHVCVCVCVCVCVQATLDRSVILGAIAIDGVASQFRNALTCEWLAGRSVGRLLYRGSAHGMTAAAFHARCDGKGPTLTLIRADEGGRVCVFGGYTSASWASPVDPLGVPAVAWLPCGDAFLFAVASPHATVTRFPLQAGKGPHATKCHPNYGPCFGDGDVCVRTYNTKRARFDDESSCWYFGHPYDGVYVDSVGTGTQTFTGTVDGMGRFVPVDIEVYGVRDSVGGPHEVRVCVLRGP